VPVKTYPKILFWSYFRSVRFMKRSRENRAGTDSSGRAQGFAAARASALEKLGES
jgi:hypothetical protein